MNDNASYNMPSFQKDYWERKKLTKRRTPEHPVVAAYVLPKIKALSQYVSLTPQTSLLDIGCGNGFFTYHLNKICNVTGVDYSEKMLEMNPVKNKALMDAADLKFEDNSFDISFCRALLHHVEDANQVIQEMKRVTRKYVVILEPNRNNPLKFLFALLVKEEHEALRFSLKFMKDLVQRNNLKIIASFSFGMITPNKTPALLLPFLNLFNFKNPLLMTNFIIAEKPEQS